MSRNFGIPVSRPRPIIYFIPFNTPTGIPDYSLYLKGKRYEEELKVRITDIINIYEMKHPPVYNPNCASCKFITSLKKEKYV